MRRTNEISKHQPFVLTLSRQRMVTTLTLIAVGAWIGSLILRAVQPSFNGGATVDAVMLAVIGFWFTIGHTGGGES